MNRALTLKAYIAQGRYLYCHSLPTQETKGLDQEATSGTPDLRLRTDLAIRARNSTTEKSRVLGSRLVGVGLRGMRERVL